MVDLVTVNTSFFTRLFWRVSFPTGTAAYQGAEGSVGASNNEQR